MIREQMADLQLKLDVGWVANCPVKIKQQGEKAIAEWKTDQLIIVLCAEIEKMENPYPVSQRFVSSAGNLWEECRQAILDKLKEGAE